MLYLLCSTRFARKTALFLVGLCVCGKGGVGDVWGGRGVGIWI